MSRFYEWGMPLNASAHGAGIDKLIFILHVSMTLLFVGWFIFLVYTLIRFRQRKNHIATGAEHHFKLPTVVEVMVAVFELVLLVTFSIPLWQQMRQQFPEKGKGLEVRVVAQQFAWNVHYPGKDGRFGKTAANLMNSGNPVGLDLTDPSAKDDIVTINQLHVPVHVPVTAHLSSKDVIHSFDLPEMRVKQDVIPGQSIRVWFEAAKTGNFEIACAQLCGLGHYRMRGFFIVETPEQFEAWLAEQAPKPEPAPVVSPIQTPATIPAQPAVQGVH